MNRSITICITNNLHINHDDELITTYDIIVDGLYIVHKVYTSFKRLGREVSSIDDRIEDGDLSRQIDYFII